MIPPSFGTVAKLEHYLWGLAATLAIAFLGTLLAAFWALPFGFLAARNAVPNIILHFATRRVRTLRRLAAGSGCQGRRALRHPGTVRRPAGVGLLEPARGSKAQPGPEPVA